MIKGGFFNDGFGDLLRKLVEVPEILIPGGGVGSRGCGYTSISRLCRRMTAFIHYSLSLSLSHCVFSRTLLLGFFVWCFYTSSYRRSQVGTHHTIYYTPLPTFFFFFL